uniref:PAP-associated domain-containing protein n=1 Tax=Caenorhabditis tropicalis TaxID=1561998 RepID=A0A1I7T0Y2_9PELO
MVFKLQRPPLELLDSIVTKVQLDNPHVQELEERIHRFHMEQAQTSEMLDERNMCIELLRSYLKSDGIRKQIDSQGIRINLLTVFGSFATHCAGKDSDLDVCVCASVQGKRKTLPVTILQAIHRDLEHNKDSKHLFGEFKIHEISFVQTARIPIIRFKMNNISVDMSASFHATPPRTSLAAKYINAYCQLDDRFQILVTFLKHWLKSEGNPNTHLRDYPNSYSLILMLIHVLQWFDIVPNLHQTHKELFHSKNFKSWSLTEVDHEFRYPLDQNTIELHRRKETRKLSVVQLLFLFACQYSESSIMEFYRFNMRSGEIEWRTIREPITIVDAYDTRNPGRTIQSAADIMGALRELIYLFSVPEVDMFKNLIKITTKKTYLFPKERFPIRVQSSLSQHVQKREKNRQHQNRAQNQQQYQYPGYGHFFMPPPPMVGVHPNSPFFHYSQPQHQLYAFGKFPFSNLQFRPDFYGHF